MLGIIDVGGGTRGIFGAGVLDCCLDKNIQFDYCSGVSAGAANLISYVAKQHGRCRTFYMEYAFRDEYMGWSHFRESGDFINLRYIYATLSNSGGENPLDYNAIEASSQRFVCTATEAETGRPAYFTEADLARDNYRIIAASSYVPVLNRPVEIDGRPYVDGGVSDPIPVKKAREDGIERVVVILTRPKDYFRRARKDLYFALRLRRKYPRLARAMANRAKTYNRSLREILAEDGKDILILAPKSTAHMRTLTLNKDAMAAMYEEGYAMAQRIEDWL